MAEKKTTEQIEEQKNRSAARSAAASRLREAHRAEHDGYLVEEMQARGIDWKPQPTPEEKAKAEVEKIYAEYPHLKESLLNGEAEG